MKGLKVYAWLVLAFLWAPLLMVLKKGLSMESFERLFRNSEVLDALGNSAMLGIGAAIISTIIATMTAFASLNLGKASRLAITIGMVLPLVLPEIAFGLSFLVWYQYLGLSLGWPTLLVSHVAFTLPFALLVMQASMAQFRSEPIDAARDLGARPVSVFRHGALPQIIPSLLTSFVLSFSLSFDDFLVTFFVKGIDQVTMPIKIYSMIRLKIGTEVYALSVLLFLISVACVLMTQLWVLKSQKRLR